MELNFPLQKQIESSKWPSQQTTVTCSRKGSWVEFKQVNHSLGHLIIRVQELQKSLLQNRIIDLWSMEHSSNPGWATSENTSWKIPLIFSEKLNIHCRRQAYGQFFVSFRGSMPATPLLWIPVDTSYWFHPCFLYVKDFLDFNFFYDI